MPGCNLLCKHFPLDRDSRRLLVNPIHVLVGGASGPKPTCDPPVAALDVSHLKGTDGPLVADREDQFNPNLAVIGSAWAKAGCYEDSPKFPTVQGANQPYYDNSGLSVTSCTTMCGKSNKKAAAMMKRAGTWVSALRIARCFWEFPPTATFSSRCAYAQTVSRQRRWCLPTPVPYHVPVC